ncbi:amidohydrolase [Corynebacterium sp. L4756]|uniref:amidohydrolase n=1 Tax=unclassified Corynebacterium TaxID=2624378 RepID=UPI00374D7964
MESELDEIGLEHFRCGGTGVVAIDKNGDGPTVAFRADMDALPIKEDTGAEFASESTAELDGATVPVMHGCGHDMHTTAALTAARLVHEQSDSWSGTIVWIFQPAEETAEGSQAMVDDGLWDKAPKPDIVLGQHVFPFETGTINYTLDAAMAAADSLKITLHGEQAHGSQPENSIDPIVLGAHIVTRLQTIVGREIAPLDSAVVTVGTFNAGLKENIIPDRAELKLNIRTLTPDVREHVLASITRIVNAEAEASGAPQPEIEEIYTFPQLKNDPEEGAKVADALNAELGDDNVIETPPLMGSEDFPNLAEAIGVPSMFWFFGGAAKDDENPAKNHSPRFLPVEDTSLTTAVRAAIAAVGSYVAK